MPNLFFLSVRYIRIKFADLLKLSLIIKKKQIKTDMHVSQSYTEPSIAVFPKFNGTISCANAENSCMDF